MATKICGKRVFSTQTPFAADVVPGVGGGKWNMMPLSDWSLRLGYLGSSDSRVEAGFYCLEAGTKKFYFLRRNRLVLLGRLGAENVDATAAS